MNIKEIELLIDKIDTSNITSLEIENDSFKICIKKEKQNNKPIIMQKDENIKYTSKPNKDKKVKEEDIITAPIVGVFYEASSPNDKPYVCIGDEVKKGQTLCILEAMKIMNEIVSEKKGTVEEIYVKNGEIVEYGQPLFRII